MVDDTHRFRERMACLADQSRFRIVLALADAEYCVSALARVVGLSQSCTTRHLQALGRHGLVRGKRSGRQVVFAICHDIPEVRLVVDGSIAAPTGEAPNSPDPPSVSPAFDSVVYSDMPPAANYDRPDSQAEEASRSWVPQSRSNDLEDYLL